MRVLASQGHAHKAAGDVHGIDRSNIPGLRQGVRVLVLMPWWSYGTPLPRLYSLVALFAKYQAYKAWDTGFAQQLIATHGLRLPAGTVRRGTLRTWRQYAQRDCGGTGCPLFIAVKISRHRRGPSRLCIEEVSRGRHPAHPGLAAGRCATGEVQPPPPGAATPPFTPWATGDHFTRSSRPRHGSHTGTWAITSRPGSPVTVYGLGVGRGR